MKKMEFEVEYLPKKVKVGDVVLVGKQGKDDEFYLYITKGLTQSYAVINLETNEIMSEHNTNDDVRDYLSGLVKQGVWEVVPAHVIYYLED